MVKSRRAKAAWVSKPTRVLVVCSLGIFVLAIAVAIWGRTLLAWYYCLQARKELKIGCVTGAQRWLDRACRVAPENGDVELLRAGIFRRLKDAKRFSRALAEAERKGVSQQLLERERRLALIQAGRSPPGPENDVNFLIAQGYDPSEVAGAFTYGALVRGNFAQAWRILETWAADRPQDPTLRYLRGVFWEHRGEIEKALQEWRDLVAAYPRHELARLALAELLEREGCWEELYASCRNWNEHVPKSLLARAYLARVLRKLGRWEEGRQILHESIAEAFDWPQLAREMGELELETGSAPQALVWLRRLDVGHSLDRSFLHLVAVAQSLSGRAFEGLAFMERADALFANSARIHEIQARLAMRPNESTLTQQLEQLAEEPLKILESKENQVPTLTNANVSEITHSKELFLRYCAACHGREGAADGPASRFLFPRARNFRRDSFRIVSTGNAVPTVEDVAVVIRQGMPGTAMRAFPEFSQEQLLKLAEVVLELRRQGLREHLMAILQAEDDKISEEELSSLVAIRTTPGAKVVVPMETPVSKDLLELGQKAYRVFGCRNCHGEDGGGPCGLALWDDQGFPNAVRDLRHDPFKGGESVQELYLRVFLGMPGTAHPACPNASPQELVAMARFCQSLRSDVRTSTTNYLRWRQAEEQAWAPAYESPLLHNHAVHPDKGATP